MEKILNLQVKTDAVAEEILPKPPLRRHIYLILSLSLLTAVFEAFFPESFKLIDPWAGKDVSIDTLKNFGLIVAFGLSLGYICEWRLINGKRTFSPNNIQILVRSLVNPASLYLVLANATRIIAFSLLITLLARVSIHFGTNPVPITGQTLAVLITGAALGSRLGAFSTFMYLAQGSAGLHVFAGGATGFFWNIASGGYLVGFVAAAFLIGFMVERGWANGTRLMMAMLAGNIILYIPGLLQLAFFVGWDKTLSYGLYPFIPGDLAKLYIASLLLPTAWNLVQIKRRNFAIWK